MEASKNQRLVIVKINSKNAVRNVVNSKSVIEDALSAQGMAETRNIPQNAGS